MLAFQVLMRLARSTDPAFLPHVMAYTGIKASSLPSFAPLPQLGSTRACGVTLAAAQSTAQPRPVMKRSSGPDTERTTPRPPAALTSAASAQSAPWPSPAPWRRSACAAGPAAHWVGYWRNPSFSSASQTLHTPQHVPPRLQHHQPAVGRMQPATRGRTGTVLAGCPRESDDSSSKSAHQGKTQTLANPRRQSAPCQRCSCKPARRAARLRPRRAWPRGSQ
jgi:hypothetical protein